MMLILERYPGQQIFIGDAKITFLSSNKGSTRVGIEAPSNIKITRPELDEKYEKTN